VFVTKKILEMGVASAVINYNDGLRGFQRVFTQLQIPPGSFMLSGSLRKDIDRVKNMDKKTQVKQKSRRKKLRSIKKGYTDQENLMFLDNFSFLLVVFFYFNFRKLFLKIVFSAYS